MKNLEILFVDVQPTDVMEAMGYGENKYLQLIRDALDLSVSITKVHAIYNRLPASNDFDGIIMGGSKCSVYENHPWQKNLENWTRKAVQKNIPFLGICYGHQTLIKALGGTVEKDKNGKEFGVTTITLTGEGRHHVLFKDIPSSGIFYTVHEDSAVNELLPKEFTVLATNPAHPIQAVAYNARIFGMQMHPEFTKEFMISLVKKRITDKKESERIISDIKNASKETEILGKKILRNFIEGPVIDFRKTKRGFY